MNGTVSPRQGGTGSTAITPNGSGTRTPAAIGDEHHIFTAIKVPAPPHVHASHGHGQESSNGATMKAAVIPGSEPSGSSAGAPSSKSSTDSDSDEEDEDEDEREEESETDEDDNLEVNHSAGLSWLSGFAHDVYRMSKGRRRCAPVSKRSQDTRNSNNHNTNQ